MRRTNIYLTDEQRRLLTDRARAVGSTMAAVVRLSVDRELGLAARSGSLEGALSESAGIWADRSEEELAELGRFRSMARAEPA
jgi:hypothetical protein